MKPWGCLSYLTCMAILSVLCRLSMAWESICIDRPLQDLLTTSGSYYNTLCSYGLCCDITVQCWSNIIQTVWIPITFILSKSKWDNAGRVCTLYNNIPAYPSQTPATYAQDTLQICEIALSGPRYSSDLAAITHLITVLNGTWWMDIAPHRSMQRRIIQQWLRGSAVSSTHKSSHCRPWHAHQLQNHRKNKE